jgi:hypothetical protein
VEKHARLSCPAFFNLWNFGEVGRCRQLNKVSPGFARKIESEMWKHGLLSKNPLTNAAILQTHSWKHMALSCFLCGRDNVD